MIGRIVSSFAARVTPGPGSGYRLGSGSRANLRGVHPKLVACVELAIQRTGQDFIVLDGVRTMDEQRKLVNRGASKTMNSKHLVQPDGYGHAVDLVPIVAGKPRWEWLLIYPIAEAMASAAFDTGVKLRWGGDWAVMFPAGASRPPSADELERRVSAYVDARRAKGLTAFIDGPHYEIQL